MKVTRLAILAAAAVTLAVPAAASAHPSVYSGTATIDLDPDPGQYLEGTQTRHMVTNHGYTTVLRETNGVIDKGVMSYALLPGDLRATLPDKAAWLPVGETGAQAHATCSGVTALSNPDNILAWQAPDDPFYNYVPFQKASAGLDDSPAAWMDDVQALTGVDLSTVSDDPAQAATQLEALCEGIDGPGGTAVFEPADQTQNTIAALASGTVEHETAPLIAEIDELTTFTAQLEAQKAAAEKAAADARAAMAGAQGAAAAAQGAATAAQAEVARLKLEATRLRISPVGGRSPAQLASNGASVRVTGPAGKPVTIRLLVSEAVAKALGLKSRVLGKRTATIGPDASALVRINLGRRAKAAMRSAKRSITVSFKAVSEDRSAAATRRLSR
jgi:hypothetical protein